MAIERFRKVLYTPGDLAKDLLDSLPATATVSLDIEIYGFTDTILAANIIAAANRGVKVRIMNDRSQAAGPSDHLVLQMLVDAGVINGNITVKIVESERGAIDHLKQTIIDGLLGSDSDACAVTYGSFNYSGSGTGSNASGAQAQDNIFVYENDPGICAQALKKFAWDWEHNKQNAAWQLQPTTRLDASSLAG